MPVQRLNLTTNASFQILYNASLTTHPTIQRYTQSVLSLPASKNNKKDSDVSVHDIKAYRESKVQLHSFLNSTLDEDT